jgi:DNA-binding NtrC family response regulator
MRIHDRNFTFYGAVHELEERLIKQALELEGGNVSRAAERLGLKRQTLANMLRDRHSKLYEKRTPPMPRLKSIVRKDS